MIKFIQTKCPILQSAFIVYALTLLAGCNQQSYNSPEGYDLNKPQVMQLGKVLNEISGLSYNSDNNTLLAVSDSKEKIFELNIERRKLKDYSERVVEGHADLEDLVKIDSVVYLLGSRGIIYEIPAHKHADTAHVLRYPFSSLEKNDFETLYYDPSVKGLVMICKSCASESSEENHSAYRFNLGSKQFDSTSFYTIDEKDVKKMLKDNDAKFKPSAAAIHPITKRLYILSSAGNLLVIANIHGTVLEAYHINPNTFPQAEGIAFAPNGDMYISNEGKYGGKATLQFFAYHPENKK
jgi:uncharacterized protein YjiK